MGGEAVPPAVMCNILFAHIKSNLHIMVGGLFHLQLCVTFFRKVIFANFELPDKTTPMQIQTRAISVNHAKTLTQKKSGGSRAHPVT